MCTPVHDLSCRAGRWPVFVIGVAVTLALVLPSAATASSVSCGSVITQSTTLSHDLTGCPGDGLVIGSANVTLNLGGHRVSGVGNGNGVSTAGYGGITIKNGSVSNFDRGVVAAGGTVTRLKLAHNDVGLFTVGAVSVTDSLVVSNGTGLLLDDGPGPITVRGDIFAGNQGDGVFGSTEAEPTDYEYNSFLNNGGNGIFIEDATSRLVHNVAAGNGANGIYVVDETEGEFFPYFFADNAAYRNGGLGIWFDRPADELAGTDGGGNVAALNGDPRQCVNIRCSPTP